MWIRMWNCTIFLYFLIPAFAIREVMFPRGKPFSGEDTSTEPRTSEPSVSLHLAARTRATLGIIAVTFHHSIKDFPVSWTAGADSGEYSFSLSFLLSFLPFFFPSWRHRFTWIRKWEISAQNDITESYQLQIVLFLFVQTSTGAYWSIKLRTATKFALNLTLGTTNYL